jgi:nanoRNase/pAp phosphatase (c-di-AMP/oligoRNAs hydrolase)
MILALRLDKPNKQFKASLRCNSDAQWDMNQLAACYGGGGHKAASGLILPLNQMTPDKAYAHWRKDIAKQALKLFLG